MAVEVRVIPANELSARERDAIHSLDRRVDWGSQPDGRTFIWSQPTWSTLVRNDEQIVSHVGIIEREVLIDARPTRIGGIAGVMTEPELQGRGHARAGLERAFAFVRENMNVPFALLLALEHRRSLYEGLGWMSISNPVFCDQPDGKVLLTIPGRHIMQWPLSDQVPPASTIDLCGLPW